MWLTLKDGKIDFANLDENTATQCFSVETYFNVGSFSSKYTVKVPVGVWILNFTLESLDDGSAVNTVIK
ncbi:hypothetical protein [Brachyspira pilosicoli]|uniref:hypothetical protein n=1 Tax=Brachyspira pilosicoli TaxID=52584 RepID=UPI001CA509B8|nr:hypothetical protein [Brachyspira pilosicoli]MBW5382313.1 hypothetical protein [Brachyspira pilosicoli]